MLSRILVCLDGSERSERALDWIPSIAAKAEILLLRVVEPVYALDVYSSALTEELTRNAEKYLAKASAKIQPRPKGVVRLGPAAWNILEVADSKKADLIAITTHGGSRFGRRLFGGTAEKLIHQSPLPLFIVPSSEEARAPRKNIQTIVVPVDGSDISEKVLGFAAQVARRHDAEVVLTHVLTGPEEIRRRFAGLEGHFRALTTRFREDWVKARQVIKYGRAEEKILETVRETDADMIVMAAHGHGALKRIFVGSTASRVIGEAGVPVLVLNHAALAAVNAASAGATSQGN